MGLIRWFKRLTNKEKAMCLSLLLMGLVLSGLSYKISDNTGDLLLNFGTECIGLLVTFAILEKIVDQQQQQSQLKMQLMLTEKSSDKRTILSMVRNSDLDLFSRADLRLINLEEVDLTDMNFKGADLSWANLQGSILSNASFQNARLKHATLCGSNLHNINLQKADLSGAKLENAILQGANLTGANLTGANLTRATLDKDTILPDGSHYSPDKDLLRFTQATSS